MVCIKQVDFIPENNLNCPISKSLPGGLFGCLSCFKSADWLGRRKAILLASVITVIGGALQAGSVNIAMYIVMRFITGLGIGKLIPVLHMALESTQAWTY